MTAVLDTAIDQWTAHDIGPRVEGGSYLHGSWGETYTVESIRPYRHNGMPWSMTVRWESGAVTTHHTAWRHGRDQIVRQPGGST